MIGAVAGSSWYADDGRCGYVLVTSSILSAARQDERGNWQPWHSISKISNRRRRPSSQRTFSGWSIEELTEYIAALEAEIERTRETIAARQDHMSGAESLFKK